MNKPRGTLDTAFSALVLNETGELAETPVMQSLVSVPTPVIVFDTAWVTDYDATNILLDAGFGYLVRELVAEIRGPPRERFTCLLCTITRPIRPFRLVFFAAEVMSVLV